MSCYKLLCAGIDVMFWAWNFIDCVWDKLVWHQKRKVTRKWHKVKTKIDSTSITPNVKQHANFQWYHSFLILSITLVLILDKQLPWKYITKTVIQRSGKWGRNNDIRQNKLNYRCHGKVIITWVYNNSHMGHFNPSKDIATATGSLLLSWIWLYR